VSKVTQAGSVVIFYGEREPYSCIGKDYADRNLEHYKGVSA
jgi:hypothetical protein